jgi:2-oxoglutarate ferredoxin oxidoreductase subunit gamma
MNQHSEIILAGSGGQGLILSGILLAQAAMLEGKNVVQTQSYGIASRGGLSLAEVIVDADEIIFQQVRAPSCVLALTEEAVKKFETWADRDKFIGRDFTRQASALGNAGSVNILALAALAAYTRVVKIASLEGLLRKRFSGPALELNLKLLAAGSALAGA